VDTEHDVGGKLKAIQRGIKEIIRGTSKRFFEGGRWEREKEYINVSTLEIA
jgi:hypothetical protein